MSFVVTLMRCGNLTLTSINEPMVQLVSLYVVLLEVAEAANGIQ